MTAFAPPGISRSQADLRYPAISRIVDGSRTVDFLSDSLMLLGGTVAPLVLNLTNATTAGATSVVVSNPWSAYSTPSSPAVGNVLVFDPNKANEDRAVITAVTGTGPWTLTVGALTNAHAANAVVRTRISQFNAWSVPMWLHYLSGGKIKLGQLLGHGGYTAQQIIDVYLSLITAKKGGCVVVQAGTNPVVPGTYDLADVNVVASIWDAILATGSKVIACSIPPSNAFQSGNTWQITRFNAALHAAARKRKLPWVNSFGALVESGVNGTPAAGGYLAGNNQDNTHWNEDGAQKVAQLILDAATGAGVVPLVGPYLWDSNIQSGDSTTFPYQTSNALFLASTSGIPTGWARVGSGTGTPTCATRTGHKGNAFGMHRALNATVDEEFISPVFTATPGHRYRCALVVETDRVDTAYAALRTTTGGNTGTTSSTFSGIDIRITDHTARGIDCLGSIKTWKLLPTGSVGVMEFDFVMPSGLTDPILLLDVRLRGANPTLDYSVWISQFTVDDLTAEGQA